MRRRSRATCHALCAALGTCVRTDGRTDGWIVCAVHNETVAARDERESRVFFNYGIKIIVSIVT